MLSCFYLVAEERSGHSYPQEIKSQKTKETLTEETPVITIRVETPIILAMPLGAETHVTPSFRNRNSCP